MFALRMVNASHLIAGSIVLVACFVIHINMEKHHAGSSK